ncbi:hypothetical protein V5O48_017630 [Marasmius crinis-equi]|uniref:Uncharacterized protein n=1 Tax=Marasmius crinis-equi TaxID=585013 RepID=A0ABR3ENF5_9AGAR
MVEARRSSRTTRSGSQARVNISLLQVKPAKNTTENKKGKRDVDDDEVEEEADEEDELDADEEEERNRNVGKMANKRKRGTKSKRQLPGLASEEDSVGDPDDEHAGNRNRTRQDPRVKKSSQPPLPPKTRHTQPASTRFITPPLPEVVIMTRTRPYGNSDPPKQLNITCSNTVKNRSHSVTIQSENKYSPALPTRGSKRNLFAIVEEEEETEDGADEKEQQLVEHACDPEEQHQRDGDSSDEPEAQHPGDEEAGDPDAVKRLRAELDPLDSTDGYHPHSSEEEDKEDEGGDDGRKTKKD